MEGGVLLQCRNGSIIAYRLCKYVLRSLFFNRSSAEPKGSANSIQGFRRIESRNGNQTTIAATRRVFWVLSASKSVGAPPRTLLDERTVATALPQTLYLADPFPRTSSPLSAFTVEFHDFPLDKFLAMPMGSMSNQNCCKGFRFKEKVKKTLV